MKRFVWVILSLAIFSSCKKELSDNFTAYNGAINDTTWKTTAEARVAIAAKLADLFQVNTYAYSVDVSQGATNTLPGSEITAPAAFCAVGATPLYTGVAEMELTFIKKKGDFIRLGQSTVAKGIVVNAVAGYNLSITSQSGTQLTPVAGAPVQILIQADKPSSQAKLFYTGIDNTGNFTWVQAGDADGTIKAFTNGNGSSISSGYDLTLKRWGWLGCGSYVDTSLPTSTVTAILPVNYTNMNTIVYVVFKNQLSVVRLTPDTFGKVFFTNNIPQNSDVAIVAIAKRGDDIYYGSTSLSVAKGNNIVKVSPQVVTRAQLASLLDAL
ncbi:MAG: hypothetical protein J0I41_01485 [Filimonas sp.]|nr:hypothetical protein [Filimonas sp.]